MTTHAESIYSDLQRRLYRRSVHDTHNIEHRTEPVFYYLRN